MTKADVENVLNWEHNVGKLEIPFKPARVLLQDFTCVTPPQSRLPWPNAPLTLRHFQWCALHGGSGCYARRDEAPRWRSD